MSEENQVAAVSVPAEEETEQDIHVLKKIRIDKLDELKAAGKNPYEKIGRASCRERVSKSV